MTELSPAAKAVLIAEAKSRCLREERGCHPDEDDWNGCWFCVHRRGLADALRAAAYQVVPSDPYRPERWEEKDEIRSEFLAIADELEAQ